MRQRRRAELDIGLDERWKERMMTGAVVVVRLLPLILLLPVERRRGKGANSVVGRRAAGPADIQRTDTGAVRSEEATAPTANTGADKYILVPRQF